MCSGTGNGDDDNTCSGTAEERLIAVTAGLGRPTTGAGAAALINASSPALVSRTSDWCVNRERGCRCPQLERFDSDGRAVAEMACSGLAAGVDAVPVRGIGADGVSCGLRSLESLSPVELSRMEVACRLKGSVVGRSWVVCPASVVDTGSGGFDWRATGSTCFEFDVGSSDVMVAGAAGVGVGAGVCESSVVGALVVLCDEDAAPGRRPTFGLKARPPVFFSIELILTIV
jgi:hypothetical protein